MAPSHLALTCIISSASHAQGVGSGVAQEAACPGYGSEAGVHVLWGEASKGLWLLLHVGLCEETRAAEAYVGGVVWGERGEGG